MEHVFRIIAVTPSEKYKKSASKKRQKRTYYGSNSNTESFNKVLSKTIKQTYGDQK